MSLQQIKVPDIGEVNDVEIIEIHVKPGDVITKDQALITLESEKTTIEIPSTLEGVVESLAIKVGDKVSQDQVILTLNTANHDDKAKDDPLALQTQKPLSADQDNAQATSPTLIPVTLPDMGDVESVWVTDIAVKCGDKVDVDATLLTIESEKTTMDVPSTQAGIVKAIKAKPGDKLSKDAVIALIAPSDSKYSHDDDNATVETLPKHLSVPMTAIKDDTDSHKKSPVSSHELIYASPIVRRLARTFDIDLSKIKGTGIKGRITKNDIEHYVKSQMQTKVTSNGLPVMPTVDFSRFGNTTVQPLTRIQQATANNMQRNSLLIPHVTQFDEVDITDMEAFRQANKHKAKQQGFKLTPLVFLIKAVVAALKAYPRFNSSLSADCCQLVIKHYYHLGIAVDTPNGLVVPVIFDVDTKGLLILAKELAQISQRARDGKLLPKEMQGGCFTISSLGGIGGSAFTPIINAPEVAILGVSTSQMKPYYDGNSFLPRLMLPLSLSYDHRVIDGALGAKFMVFLKQYLTDIRKLLL